MFILSCVAHEKSFITSWPGYCFKDILDIFVRGCFVTNLWTPAADREYICCLEIQQRQFEFISRPNKTFVHSLKCI